MFSESFRRLAIILIVVSIGFPPEVSSAQTEKRIYFPKGKTSVTFKGRLPRSFDYDTYFFPAKKGQTLTVKLISADPEAYLAVYETKELGPAEDTILANDERSREWSGHLPIKSEYSVQVYDAAENGINRAAYTVEITLK